MEVGWFMVERSQQTWSDTVQYLKTLVAAIAIGASGLQSISSAQADILSQIAQCESGGRQFEADGKTPMLNRANRRMVGLFQINMIHIPNARRLGMNIFTAEGNRAYAMWLYARYGTQPWVSSIGCWGRRVVAQR